MGKKVVCNGIEIFTNESDSSARSLLGVVESLIEFLETDLERVDENFYLFINMEFAPNRPTKHSFSLTSFSNNKTREKVMKILEKSANSQENNISGTMRVDLEVRDG